MIISQKNDICKNYAADLMVKNVKIVLHTFLPEHNFYNFIQQVLVC